MSEKEDFVILDQDEVMKKSSDEGSRRNSIYTRIDIALFFVAIIAFVLIGSLAGGWNWGWLVFLLYIVVVSILTAIKNRKPNDFAYAIFILMIYLFVGLNYGVWHPTWVMFLTVPVFYIILGIFKTEKR